MGSHGKRPMGWDRHKLLWDRNGTDKYVPWTTLGLSLGMSFLWESHGKRPMEWVGDGTVMNYYGMGTRQINMSHGQPSQFNLVSYISTRCTKRKASFNKTLKLRSTKKICLALKVQHFLGNDLKTLCMLWYTHDSNRVLFADKCKKCSIRYRWISSFKLSTVDIRSEAKKTVQYEGKWHIKASKNVLLKHMKILVLWRIKKRSHALSKPLPKPMHVQTFY